MHLLVTIVIGDVAAVVVFKSVVSVVVGVVVFRSDVPIDVVSVKNILNH